MPIKRANKLNNLRFTAQITYPQDDTRFVSIDNLCNAIIKA